MRIMGICFHGSTQLHYRALRATGWCDAFYLQPNDLVGGLTGTIDDLKKLNIDYKKYNAALIYQDGLGPTQKYFVEQCVKNGVTIYANQHGFNKSIQQIVDGAPNIYSKYWNSTGKYFLDRYLEVTGNKPINGRWISIGSLVHDYLYKNYRWDARRNNGKALIIHEPDLRACEGDPHPHDSETITAFVINQLRKTGIKADFKPHPNWKNFIGNTGEPLKKPKGVPFVDIKVEEIVNYALVIGSRSSMLLEAAVMGIPTLAVESNSSWEDDKYPPVEDGENGLIPTYSNRNFQKGLKKHFGTKPKYDLKELQYYCGPLGKVSENYYDFIKNDQKYPNEVLEEEIYNRWKDGLRNCQAQTYAFRYVRDLTSKFFYFYRLAKGLFQAFAEGGSNSISFQRKFWADQIANYDGKKLYGYDWGDPVKNIATDSLGVTLGNYAAVLENYLLPKISGSVVVDIGSGGGKWVQFMKKAKQIICVDLSNETLDYIRKKLGWKKLRFYKTAGDELKGISDCSVDFIFSMDTLVRTPILAIAGYFKEMNRVLKPKGEICLHLPCGEIPGSVRRGFVDLSILEIQSMCHSNDLEVIDIDRGSITHGVILRAKKNVRN